MIKISVLHNIVLCKLYPFSLLDCPYSILNLHKYINIFNFFAANVFLNLDSLSKKFALQGLCTVSQMSIFYVVIKLPTVYCSFIINQGSRTVMWSLFIEKEKKNYKLVHVIWARTRERDMNVTKRLTAYISTRRNKYIRRATKKNEK